MFTIPLISYSEYIIRTTPTCGVSNKFLRNKIGQVAINKFRIQSTCTGWHCFRNATDLMQVDWFYWLDLHLSPRVTSSRHDNLQQTCYINASWYRPYDFATCAFLAVKTDNVVKLIYHVTYANKEKSFRVKINRPLETNLN